MRNKDLPRLLRAMASGTEAQERKTDVIFIQAAVELEKLDAIETLIKTITAFINDKSK